MKRPTLMVSALAMLLAGCAGAVNQDETPEYTRVNADSILQRERGSANSAATVSMRTYTILGTKSV